MARDQRRLAAIVSADVAGYSRLMGRDESGTLATLKGHRRELIDSKIAEHGGRIVKTTGDGLLLEFASVVEAVRCAVEVQRGMAVRNAEVPAQERIEFRIGINVGDIIIDGEDMYGDGVNVAARLQALADPGGICVGKVVRDQVIDKLTLAFENLGPREVKNIVRPVEVFRADWKGSLVPKSFPTADIPGVDPLSIVVLPFRNLTGDINQEYVADGVTDSLTADLARIREAFVVNVATAFVYKDKPVTAQQVGKELGVHFVLQGSVQRNGTRIRINSQLANAASNAQVWSESFEGDQSDLFALLDRVTTLVGNSISRAMVIVAARESETRKSSPRLADLLLRARALQLRPRTLKNEQQAEELYRQALALEPNSASTMVALAGSLALQPDNFGYQIDESGQERKYIEARDLVLKAKELDPDDPRVYTVMGIYATDHGEFAEARRAFETVLSLEPRNPNAYANLAKVFLAEGQPRRAIELLTQAINLRPKHVHEFVLLLMGVAHFMLGENDAAIEWLLKSLERNPTYSMTYAYLAMTCALKGKDAEMQAAAAQVRRLDPDTTLSTFNFNKFLSLSPPAYQGFYESKLVPAWRKAGLRE